jgi:hypothetical protein
MSRLAKPIRPSRAARQRALVAARAVGCTCRPDFELARFVNDELQQVRALHDHACPAADAGRTLMLCTKGGRAA